MVKKLFLIRHGESEANANGIHQGQRIDSPLSTKGISQAKKIAKFLKKEKVDIIYSSDLKRAKETAEEINKVHNVKLVLDKRLREFDLGDFTQIENKWDVFQKYKKEEASKNGLEAYKISPPNGESEWAHFLRVEEFLNEILKNKEENVVIVAHGGTNKIFFGVTEHVARNEMYGIKQSNACLNEFEFDNKKWVAKKINFVEHLEESKTTGI
jgi:broad specificity phosphatase PhoE